MTSPQAGLEARLRQRVRGDVRFDAGSRALYATDASNYRQAPLGVVIPRDAEDVVEAVAAARNFGAPLLSRGGGTSLAGQCCNVALLVDCSKHLRRVIAIDAALRTARVEPGCVLDDMRAAARAHGLTFGPDPATHTHCTLGGMLGNNSCGVHSLLSARHGFGLRTSDNTHSLEVLTYDGVRLRVGPTSDAELGAILAGGGRRAQIYAALRALRDRHADLIRRRFPRLPRRVSGYNLDELLPENGFNVARALVGTESTCVTILEATLHLIPEPRARALLVLGYPDVFHAADDVTLILEHQPSGLEGMDDLLLTWMQARGDRAVKDAALLPPGGGWLLVELAGDSRADAEAQAGALLRRLERLRHPPAMQLYQEADAQRIWKIRESGLGVTARIPGGPDTWPGWEDAAVPVEHVGAYLRAFRALLARHRYQASLYGHFGQGCIHCSIDFDLRSQEGLRRWEGFMGEATDLVVSLGGSLSGEHGDGQARGPYLAKMFGPELVEAFREFKRIWDPEWKMNPGKVVDAPPITTHLRLGPDFDPPRVATHFSYRDDDGSFARATERCVGVGACRRESGGTMCPSYRVTHDEEHSTRGRARLLFEMMRGDLISDGWASDVVKHALDLCLSCKGCKSDCPANVDMATYKAEFLSHYYEHHRRPRHAYVFGFIHDWARLGALAPLAANALTQTPLVGRIAKRVLGTAAGRALPALAPRSFRSWFRGHRPRHPEGPPVVLWPDTFNDFFRPETARAAVEVLEDAGYRVTLPERDLCCGRPLYDYGFLDTAKAWLITILDTLGPRIRSGEPVVVLEPSCAAVFRDELLNLFPTHPDARLLASQTLLLSELLQQRGYRPPQLPRAALVHGHCHQKALMGMDDETAILAAMGIDACAPESGCCGMAGAFGFESDHYAVSVACGERALLPAVRAATDDALVIADGFSCREQIAQGTGRRALHLAEVLQLALRQRR